MIIESETIKTVRDTNNTSDIMRHHGKPVSKCPLCNSDNFSIKPDMFYCFHCNAGGDVLALEMRLAKCAFGEAVERLLSR